MSKVLLDIDHTLPQEELFKFLKLNKKSLIAQKKSAFKKFYTPSCISSFTLEDGDDGPVVKAPGEAQIPEDANSLLVDVVMNTSMYCDSAMDVLMLNSGKKSMKERKGMIPHIHDHLWETDAEVGDVKNIFYQELPLRQLGLKKDGTAQALTFSTEIIKAYNERIFEKYRMKKVKQHSIGMYYMDLSLAINVPDDDWYEDEYKVWQKYIDQVINKELPESRGYFWAVHQYELLEGSCVLLGANFLTPTISTSESKSTTNEQPSDFDTVKGPENESAFDVSNYISELKFF